MCFSFGRRFGRSRGADEFGGARVFSCLEGGAILRSALSFHTDGTVVNQKGERGRWWVNQQGQYCRVWATGRLKGNLACLNLTRKGERIAIHSKDKKVAEGVLVRD